MKHLTALTLALLTVAAFAGEVVKNGTTPKGKAKTLTYKQEWRVDSANSNEHFIWNGASVTATTNSQGNVFVLDNGNNRVIQLDATGKFVRQIGREGDGPGEFRQPTNISMLNDQSFIVTEYRVGLNLISVFDKDGNFLRHIDANNKGKYLLNSYFSPTGKMLGATYMFNNEAGELNMAYGLLDTEIKPLMQVETNPIPRFQPNRVAEPSFWVEMLARWFSLIPHQGLIAFGQDGSVFTAKSNQYEITRYSPDLKTKLVFNRQYKPKPQSEDDIRLLSEPVRDEVLGSIPGSMHPYITDAVIDKAIAQAGLPTIRSAIFGLIPMEAGGLMVIHDFDPKTGHADCDLFDKQGLFIGTCPMPPADFNVFGGYFGCSAKIWFKSGKMYILGSDEGDYFLSCNSYKIHDVN